MLVALLKVMELTCLEKLVPSAEISPGTWLGLGQENEAGFAVGLNGTWQDMSKCHTVTTISYRHHSVLVLVVGDANGHWDRIKVS